MDWSTWFQWVLATTLGWLLGWLIVGQLALGGAVGIGQWLVLRRLLGQQTVWWILASTLGWAAGWALIVSGLIVPPGVTGLTTVIFLIAIRRRE